VKIEPKDLDLSGKRVLITGAASGIGAAMAETFSGHGADIILADRDVEGLKKKSQQTGASKIIEFDQAEKVSIDRLAGEAEPVDILLNNAGIVWMGPFVGMPPTEIERVISINLVGPIHLAQNIGKSMLKAGAGVIVNTSSQLAFHGSAERAVYAATKAGITQFTKSIAAEWAPKGVRVVAIAPGRTLTAINAATLDSTYKQTEALKGIPIGRFAEAHEMARLALLLSCDVLNYVVGETIISDGGYVLL
tara:strand:- start:274 stop:1020 length:747 start_codon:yes stop_codon:yes gene_type:complete